MIKQNKKYIISIAPGDFESFFFFFETLLWFWDKFVQISIFYIRLCLPLKRIIITSKLKWFYYYTCIFFLYKINQWELKINKKIPITPSVKHLIKLFSWKNGYIDKHDKHQLQQQQQRTTNFKKNSAKILYIYFDEMPSFWWHLMRAHRTQCRCLKRCSLCIVVVGILPIIIIYLFVSDQIYYRIKHKNVSNILLCHSFS